MTATTHVLKPALPLRPFAIAAGLAVFAAAVIVGSQLAGWSIAFSIGGVGLILLALVILLLTWWSWRAMAVTVTLDDEGFAIAGPGPDQRGNWRDITKVTELPGRIVLYQGDSKRIQLVSPHGSTASMDALATEIAQRLDLSRGYGELR
ncbi:MAG: hypothetical protein WAS07_05815 [Micropruina sp.]